MSAICRVCGKPIENKKNNAFYHDKCQQVITDKSAKRYQLGKDKHNVAWVRHNQLVSAVINGERVEVFYVLKEVIE